MSAAITLHRCTGIKVSNRWVENANQIKLAVTTEDGLRVDLYLYNLPADTTDVLTRAFGDARTEFISETPPYLAEAAS